MGISDKVYALVHSDKTLTAAFATTTTEAEQDISPGHLARTLYDEHPKKHAGGSHLEAFKALFQNTGKKDIERIQTIVEPTQEDMDRAAQCGDFGSRPSDLFLKVRSRYRIARDDSPICVGFRYTWTFWPRSTTIPGLVSCPHLFWVLEGS